MIKDIVTKFSKSGELVMDILPERVRLGRCVDVSVTHRIFGVLDRCQML